MERTAQMQQLKQDYDRNVQSHNALDQNSRVEKEQSAKLQAKVENMQERWEMGKIYIDLLLDLPLIT